VRYLADWRRLFLIWRETIESTAVHGSLMKKMVGNVKVVRGFSKQ